MNNLDTLIIPDSLTSIMTEKPNYRIDQRHEKYLKLPIGQICTRLMYINNYDLNKLVIDQWANQLKIDGYNVELRQPCELHPMINVDCCCYACREWFGCGPAKLLWIWGTDP